MGKRDGLVRFGVAMEGSLLRAIDALVKQRGGTRSALLRDLARAESLALKWRAAAMR